MEGLLRALELEETACPLEADRDLYEGVRLLRKLLETIVHGAEQAAKGKIAIQSSKQGGCAGPFNHEAH